MVIAIDGTSSSGKSSLSRTLGATLNIPVLGTGSIYRAIAYKLLNFNINENDDERIKQILENTIITSSFIKGKTIINLDGIEQKLSDLNSHDVSVFVPKIAKKDFVREFVRNIQHSIADANEDIIVEGRDIGSVVFPNAEVKLYVDADLKVRAQRRLNDYLSQGKNYTLSEVIEELEERDNEDRYRELSPLIMTSSSIIIDTSELTITDCVSKVIKIINDKKQEQNL